jgi:hypothetical protein
MEPGSSRLSMRRPYRARPHFLFFHYARNGSCKSLSLSKTSSGWRLTENRAMLSCNEESFQAHWLGGCRSISVASTARGRDLDIAAANKRSAADRS